MHNKPAVLIDWSHNGSGNGFNDRGRIGFSLGVGATYMPWRHVGFRMEINRIDRQQSDRIQYGLFTQGSLQLVYRTN